MATYNGHRSWGYWNVSLWIANDEGLYNLAQDYIRHSRRIRDAAAAMLDCLHECGITATPDGATYTVAKLATALKQLEG